MGKPCALSLVLVASVSVACDNDYPLPPTACDSYCRATQRAGCEEDWPHQCVQSCELTLSPKTHPSCSADFDALLACYEDSSDDDFVCDHEYSEPREGVCESEERSLGFCTDPIGYRCLVLCEERSELCDFDDHECFGACYFSGPYCIDEGVRWLDCELSDLAACPVSHSCTPLQSVLSSCLSKARTTERRAEPMP